MCTGQIQIFPQQMDQQLAWFCLDLVDLAVDG
jgi:hypothetical protein